MPAGRRRRIRKKDLGKAGILAVVMVIVIALGTVLISRWEDIRYATGGGKSNVYIDPIITDPKYVTVNGTEYMQTAKLQSYLLMGIDKNGPVKEASPEEGGGQADMQILLIIDDEHETWQILQLDRDTMVQEKMYDTSGNEIGYGITQLCLTHTSGTGKEDSCDNTVRAVSDFLWEQPIDGYIAMNMGGISTLNDALGGVPVKITTDFTEIDPSLKVGETITLKGDQAELFVRSRRNVDDGTNVSRMARQRAYMKSFVKVFSGLDVDHIVSVYDTVADYVVTSLGSGQVERLARKIQNYRELELVQFEGEHVRNGDFMEFHVDEANREQVIVDLFYEPVVTE